MFYQQSHHKQKTSNHKGKGLQKHSYYNHHKKKLDKANIKYQKAFDQYICQQYLKDDLQDMMQKGYNFCYSTQQHFRQNIKVKQMIRNGVYLRFICKSKRCKQKDKQKRFTSTLGTINIQFQFVKNQNKYFKTNKLLIFHFQIYRMKCKQCNIYGYPEIYDSQLERIQDQFCRIIANILDKIPPKRKKRVKDQIDVPDLKIHQHDLCQACYLGKCHQGSCP